MKGWYGDKFEHSLASKGIKSTMKTHVVSADVKWEYNYNTLSGASYSQYFIYVPVQYGNLSNDRRKVLNKDYAVLKNEKGEVIAKARLLEIGKPFVGAGRKIIWWEKREENPRENGEYWWEYGFENYRSGRWDYYKDEMKRNREELGVRW